MCADELSSKREPYFPGNYEWAPGGEVGEGARSGRDGYTREGARTSRQKIFFPFLVASLGISFSLKHNPPPPPPRAATPRPPPPSSLSLFRCERALFMQSSVYFRENRPRGEEERRTRSGQEEGKKRVAAGCGDLFLASYRSRSLAWSVDRTGADASQVPQKGWFFLLSFFFSPFSSSGERLSATALLRQITHRGFLNFPLF